MSPSKPTRTKAMQKKLPKNVDLLCSMGQWCFKDLNIKSHLPAPNQSIDELNQCHESDSDMEDTKPKSLDHLNQIYDLDPLNYTRNFQTQSEFRTTLNNASTRTFTNTSRRINQFRDSYSTRTFNPKGYSADAIIGHDYRPTSSQSEICRYGGTDITKVKSKIAKLSKSTSSHFETLRPHRSDQFYQQVKKQFKATHDELRCKYGSQNQPIYLDFFPSKFSPCLDSLDSPTRAARKEACKTGGKMNSIYGPTKPEFKNQITHSCPLAGQIRNQFSDTKLEIQSLKKIELEEILANGLKDMGINPNLKTNINSDSVTNASWKEARNRIENDLKRYKERQLMLKKMKNANEFVNGMNDMTLQKTTVDIDKSRGNLSQQNSKSVNSSLNFNFDNDDSQNPDLESMDLQNISITGKPWEKSEKSYLASPKHYRSQMYSVPINEMEDQVEKRGVLRLGGLVGSSNADLKNWEPVKIKDFQNQFMSKVRQF